MSDTEPLECGYFAQCEHDADHDGPHTAGMYPEWVVPTLEPMAFIADASPSAALDVEGVLALIEQCHADSRGRYIVGKKLIRGIRNGRLSPPGDTTDAEG